MKKTLATLLLALPLLSVNAKKTTDDKAAAAPTGDEWQSPENLALNKEKPTAYMFHFSNAERAYGVQPEKSDYYKNLDGQWKFNWVASPDERPAKFYETSYDVTGWDNIEVPGCWNVQGLQKDGTMKYGVPIYVNQPVIFYHEIKVDDWKKGVMRKAPEQWTVSKYPNEVGSYRRNFSVPTEWKGRRVYVCFDGVDSFFYLWINGKYVGFSKNSRNTAKFDITDYVTGADNTLAVEVYRTSDGSFLESQDMFRLPGIYRSVYLVSEPEVKIEDLAVRTASVTLSDVPSTASQAVVTFDAQIANLSKKAAKDYTISYTIKPVELYTDKVLAGELKSEAIAAGTQKGEGRLLHNEMTLTNAKTWSAEAPYRYVCTAELKDKKGNLIDCASTYFGVCKVEIRETPASEDEFGLKGRYFYVNNKPVKLKGVNRHETSLDRGHAITHQQMEEEVMLMKRGNINHIRMSHYSNDPYMYYLCDKYGIYLEDECNIESHEYYYGEASLSHPKEWKAAHIDRNMAMVRGHVNHPSIVIWSLGNEAGPGDNFKAAYAAIKEFDKRPVQYERNNDIVDMGSNQYPSVAWVQGAVKGNYGVKYPYHISEYAHSMGNSLGNLVDYWDAIESTNFFCGGAIWDWIDQAIDTYTEDGVKYMGYGGDHGDWPNDGMFCMNGIILPDLTPKPQYYEVKKVYQNVGVKLDSVFDMHNHTMVKFTITNKNYFTSLDDYDINGIVMCDGKPVTAFPIQLPQSIGPRESFTMTVPMKVENVQGELFLNIEFRLKEAKPWARAGYVQMNEQLFLANTNEAVELKAAELVAKAEPLKVTRGGSETCVSGNGFIVNFDDATGSLNCLNVQGQYLIESGNGLKLDAFRAPVDNDNWAWNKWFQAGLYNLQHKATAAPIITNNADGTVSVTYTVVSQAPNQGRAIMRPGKAGAPFQKIEEGREMTAEDFHFTTTQRFTIYPDGTIAMASSIVSSDPGVALPRLGYAFKMPARFDQYEYYGRGPLNNYADRKTGSFVGRYKSTVKEQFVNFPKPQSMGNREEVRWATLTDAQGTGLEFVADQSTMSTSALPWSALQMTLAAHPHELPKSDGTYVHLDCQVTGLGGNSCGQGGPLAQDRVQGALHQMKIIIRPVNRGANYQDLANVTCKTACPVSISRDRAGNVSITGDIREAKNICYQVNELGSKKPGKVQTHDARSRMACIVALRNGGTVTAWYEGDDKVKTSASFEKIENVPVTVKYVSSEEGPHGELATNLVDGNANTIWHTMYSITVPKYPHWVDFDCSEVKTIKGFTYLPRQDGPNGNIKGYKVQLSMDGENWSDPVAEGNFENNLKEKKVTFNGQKARYLRFTATSSQRGDDFASGAEFTVIAE